MLARCYLEIIRNTPTVSIPDDHDVGQANIWGEEGRKSNTGAGHDGGEPAFGREAAQAFGQLRPVGRGVTASLPGHEREHLALHLEDQRPGLAEQPVAERRIAQRPDTIGQRTVGDVAIHAVRQERVQGEVEPEEDADFGPSAEEVELETAVEQDIPVAFVRHSHDPLGAQALVCSLMISPDEAVRSKQLALIADSGVIGLVELVNTLGRQGSGPGEVNNPGDFVLMPDGTLGMVQIFPGKIVKLNLDGTPAGVFQPAFGEATAGGFLALAQ